jgi:hypothetical protein
MAIKFSVEEPVQVQAVQPQNQAVPQVKFSTEEVIAPAPVATPSQTYGPPEGTLVGMEPVAGAPKQYGPPEGTVVTSTNREPRVQVREGLIFDPETGGYEAGTLPETDPQKQAAKDYQRIQQAATRVVNGEPKPEPGRQYKNFLDETARAMWKGELGVAEGLMNNFAMASRDSIFSQEKLIEMADNIYNYSKKDSLQAGEKGGVGGFIANTIGGSVPYLAASLVATLTTGSPVGGFAVGQSVSGQSAYREAIESGASEDDARMNQFIVGIISGAVESLQVSDVIRLGNIGKGSIKAITEAARVKAWKKVREAGKELALNKLETILRESTEEAVQEITAVAAQSRLAPVENPMQRIGQAALGGGLAGFGFSFIGSADQTGEAPSPGQSFSPPPVVGVTGGPEAPTITETPAVGPETPAGPAAGPEVGPAVTPETPAAETPPEAPEPPAPVAETPPPPITGADIKGLEDLQEEVDKSTELTDEQKKFAGNYIGDIITRVDTQLIDKYPVPITDGKSLMAMAINIAKELGVDFTGYKVEWLDRKTVPGVKSWAAHYGKEKSLKFAMKSPIVVGDIGSFWNSPGKFIPIKNKTPGQINQDFLKRVLIHEIGHIAEKAINPSVSTTLPSGFRVAEAVGGKGYVIFRHDPASGRDTMVSRVTWATSKEEAVAAYNGHGKKRSVHHPAFVKWVQNSIKTALNPIEKKTVVPVPGQAFGRLPATTESEQPTDSTQQPNKTVLELLEKYEDGDIESITDFVDSIRELENLTPEIEQAITDYDDAVNEDRFKYGMRSGLDNDAEEALIKAIKSSVKDSEQGPSMDRVTAKADPRLTRIMAKNLYETDISTIIVKELLQNARDAIMGLPHPGKSNIELVIDSKTRQIYMFDTGSGMSPAVAQKEFINPGDSYKPEGSAGGFGIAKYAIFANSKYILVETTTKVGDKYVKTTLTGTGADWSDPSIGLNAEVIEGKKDEVGTKINLELYSKEEGGIDDVKAFSIRDYLKNFLNLSNIPFTTNFFLDNTEIVKDSSVIGKTKTLPDKITGDGYEATVTISDDIRDEATSYPSIDILNNGVYQFTTSIGLNSEAKMPKKIIVNIKATVNPEVNNYPFSANREKIKASIERQISDYVEKELAAAAREAEQDDYKRLIKLAQKIKGSKLKILDMTGAITEEQLREYSRNPIFMSLGRAMSKSFGIIIGQLQKTPGYQSVGDYLELMGFTVNAQSKYLGIHIPGSYINVENSQILIDPAALFNESELAMEKLMRSIPAEVITAMDDEGNLLTLDEDPKTTLDKQYSAALDVFAGQMVATLVHEITHQMTRSSHGEVYAGILTRVLGHTIYQQTLAIKEIKKALKGFSHAELKKLFTEISSRSTGKNLLGKIISGQVVQNSTQGNGGSVSEPSPTGGPKQAKARRTAGNRNVTPPVNMATNDQKARVHIIARNLGYTNDQRKEIQVKLTGKKTMRGMTYDEAKLVDDFFTQEAASKGLITATADELTKRLEQVNKIVKGKPEIGGRQRRGLNKIIHSIQDATHNFIDRQWHIDRFIEQLDGMAKSIFYNTVWKKTRDASVNAAESKEQRIQRFKNAGESIFGGPKIFNSFLGAQAEDFGNGINITPAERVGVLIYAQNKNALHHLIAGNFAEFSKPQEVLAEIMASATLQEKAMAAWIIQDMEDNFDRVNQAAILSLGREIKKEENYFSMYLQELDMEQQTDFLTELLDQPDRTGKALRTPGETIARKKGARQKIWLDAINNYMHHVDRVEQFVFMGPIAKQLGEVLNNHKFRETLNNITHGTGVDILTKWLKDITRGYSAESMAQLARWMLFLRRSGVYYAMAYKIPSVIRQYLSAFTASSVHPSIAMRIGAYMTAGVDPRFYKRLQTFAFKKSAMLRNRSMERISDYINTSLTPAQRLQYRRSWSNEAMSWLRWGDRRTAVYSWVALYDSAMNSPAVQEEFGLDGSEKAALDYADSWIERTQSMGNTAYLSDFFRGGPIEKLLTTFQNEDNAKWNFWMNDILLATKYGKISKKLAAYRILMSYVIPALIFGMIGRGGPPEDWKDILVDEAVYALGPFFLFGRIIYNAVQGFSGGQQGPEDIGLTEVDKTIRSLVKQEYGKASIHAIKAAGATTGRIPSQAITTGTGVYDLSTGETKDLRRLLWTEWSLENYGKTVNDKGGSDKPSQYYR